MVNVNRMKVWGIALIPEAEIQKFGKNGGPVVR
mgnify:CR=1 FL=1